MKTLRLIGMAVIAVIMSVNFIACSDDDDTIDTSSLEGTWGLVRNAVTKRKKTLGTIPMTHTIPIMIVRKSLSKNFQITLTQ